MCTFRRLSVTLLLLLALSPYIHADEAADRSAIEAGAQAWTKAFNARDVDGLLALMTQDVVLLDPEVPPVSGAEAARALLQRAAGTAKGQLANVTKEIVTAGDVAWRIGALAHEQPSRETTLRAASLEIWKRTKGEWKIHRQMSSGILSRPRLIRRPDPSEPVLDKPVD